MGLYWAATGLGNKIAGLIGQSAQNLGEFEIFTGIAIIWSLIGLFVILLLKPLKRLTHGAEDHEGSVDAEVIEPATNRG